MQSEKSNHRSMCLKLPEPVHIAPCTRAIPCKDVVRECSVQSNHPELVRKKVYIPCYLCENVVREGSMRFDVLEPHPTSAYSTLTPSRNIAAHACPIHLALLSMSSLCQYNRFQVYNQIFGACPVQNYCSHTLCCL